MSVITSEELSDLRRFVRGASDLLLLVLRAMARREWNDPDERHHWFRVRRLVAEEWERRNGSDGG